MTQVNVLKTPNVQTLVDNTDGIIFPAVTEYNQYRLIVLDPDATTTIPGLINEINENITQFM